MAQNVRDYVHDPPPEPPAPGDDALIRVRGTRDGLVLGVPEDARAVNSRAVAAALAAHLDGAEAFFNGTEVIVDLGEREITEDELSFYRLILEEREVTLRGFAASSPEGRAVLRKGGYHPLQPAAGAASPPVAPARGWDAGAQGQSQEAGEALYLRRTLRSGARVRHHGHLVIVGDINAGAEVIASGDIIVWGVVRGMVHAGALGDDGAIICALGLSPTQLRIGSHYALPPAEGRAKGKGKDKALGGPERVRLENGQLIVEPWKLK